jgi:hypothetical protein
MAKLEPALKGGMAGELNLSEERQLSEISSSSSSSF